MVKIRHLVAEFSDIAEYQEAVGKALGNIELLLIFLRQLHAVPFPIGFGTGAHIDGHVKNAPPNHPHQLPLGILLLGVQSPENALCGHALVVLHKPHIQPGFLHVLPVVGFHEVTPVVAVNRRFDDI